jgi:hypothetical protein
VAARGLHRTLLMDAQQMCPSNGWAGGASLTVHIGSAGAGPNRIWGPLTTIAFSTVLATLFRLLEPPCAAVISQTGSGSAPGSSHLPALSAGPAAVAPQLPSVGATHRHAAGQMHVGITLWAGVVRLYGRN